MPRKRIRSKLKIEKLAPNQFWDLWLGNSFDGPPHWVFKSEEERREAWEAHKDKIMGEWRENNSPGTRPGAWWTYEAPENIFKDNRRSRELEIKYLIEWGLLEPWEIKALEFQSKTKPLPQTRPEPALDPLEKTPE